MNNIKGTVYLPVKTERKQTPCYFICETKHAVSLQGPPAITQLSVSTLIINRQLHANVLSFSYSFFSREPFVTMESAPQ